MLQGLKNIFKSYFLAGILFLGPLVICFWIVKYIVELADGLVQTSKWMPVHIPGLGLLIAVVLILLAGFLGRNVFGRYFFRKSSEVFTHLPVVGPIYKSLRQLFETLLGSHEKSFGRVVMIQFPHSKSYTLAFVTSEGVPEHVLQSCKGRIPLESNEDKLITVYVPTSPMPTAGFYMYVAESAVIPTSMTVDEAFKVIISLGLVV